VPDVTLNVPEIMKMIGELADCASNPETFAALTALTEAVMCAADGRPVVETLLAAA
jgi:hypothetical protein